MTDRIYKPWVLVSLILLALCSCEKKETMFEVLTSEETGLDFINTVEQSVDFNVFAYMYFFNGGGVGVGDFNNDGLEDVYFTGNMTDNKLFLNQGDLKFKDVTTEAGVGGIEGWSSGVSIVDINNDGRLDIYVNQIGDFGIISGKNQLFVCQSIENGVPIYEDEAEKYGLDLVGFSTQSSFFDYDLDGDLDMFQLNHSLHANGTFGKKDKFDTTKHQYSGDKLFRNDGSGFIEVTKFAGIRSTVIGYGLGVATSDLNNDGWPDLYIGNDFHENDYLYINNQNGTFSEVLTEQIMHTSRFSMGVDIGDINNDAQSEIISLDMLPSDPTILKTSLGEDDYGTFQFKIGFGYNHQYARNNLQLNNGNDTYSEIGIFAGVHATDWSWAPLFVDFDLDGYKDLFISNGIPRRMNDIDYLNFRMGDEDIRWKTNTNYIEEEDFKIIDRMPQIKLKNRFFRNDGQLSFSDISDSVKDNPATYSNGAAFADFDNDGDLDLVVNNIYEEPLLYKNIVIESSEEIPDYISIFLNGSEKNRNAIGSTLVIFKGDEILIDDNYPVRGYQSSVSTRFLVGVGDQSKVDSVFLVWPDRTFSRIADEFNTLTEVKWTENLPEFDFSVLGKKDDSISDFEDITKTTDIAHFHDENPFVEFNRERLMPHMVSSEGPALAVGDINGDGLEDIFIGGAKRVRAKFYAQNSNGKFTILKVEAVANDSIYEDVDAKLIDIDKDNDLDLLVASGGNEYWGKSEYLNSRLYENDGTGNFKRRESFNSAFLTASCIEVGDFDGDGLGDVFIGARAEPKSYGISPSSFLFKNDGNGKFTEVTSTYPLFGNLGLVKDAHWSDVDSDGDLDLIVASEWGRVTIIVNEGEEFRSIDVSEQSSWWNFVLPYDFDGDGDVDILVGNAGENSKMKPNESEPIRMYIEDFDDNDQIDQVVTYYIQGKEIPFANYKELTTQLPHLKKKYIFSKDLAAASLKEVLGEKLTSAKVKSITTLSSTYFENKGGLKFASHRLPNELQFSSIEAATITDVDENGEVEILIGGNFYDNNIEMGRYDANYGNLLKILQDGTFEVSDLGNLNVKNQVRNISPILINDIEAFILAKNEDSLQVIMPIKKSE